MAAEIGIRIGLDGAASVTSGLSAVGDKLGDLDAKSSKVGEAFRGLASSLVAGLSIAGIGSFVKGAIDAADNLNDLSKATGITVEKLSGLKLAAVQSGTDLDGIAASISKLSVNMGKDAEKFRALGVTAKDPIEAFKQLADVFVAVKDPQLRAAMAAEAIGKAWKDAAPLLSEGGQKIGEMVERGESLAGVTQEMADQADNFNDQLAELRVTASGMALELAGGLLPTLTAIVTAFNAVGAESAGSGEKTGFFTSALRTALEAIGVLGVNVVYIAKTVAGEIGTWGKQLQAFASGNFSEGMKIGQEWTETAKLMRAEVDKQSEAIVSAKTQMVSHTKETKDNAAETKAATVAAAAFVGANKDSTEASKKAAAEAKKQADEIAKLTKAGDDYLTSLRTKAAATQRELDLGRELTANEKAQLDLTDKLRAGKLRMTEATVAQARAQIDLNGQMELHRQAQEAEKKLNAEIASDKVAITDALQKETAALQEQVDKQKEDNLAAQIGAEAYARLTITRLEDQAALKDLTAANSEQNEELRKQAELLRQRAALAKQGIVVQEAQAAAAEWQKTTDAIQNGLSNALFRAFEAGNGFFKTLWNGIVNTFKTTVLQLLVKTVMSPVNAGIGSLLGAGSSAANAGSDAGSLLSSAGSLFSSVTSLAGIGTALSTFGSTAAAGFGLTLAGETGAALGSAGAMASGGALAGSAGMAIGALGPYALAALAAYAIYNKFKHEYTPHTGGAALSTADASSLVKWSDLTVAGTGDIARSKDTEAVMQQTSQSIAQMLQELSDIGTGGKVSVGTGFADDSSKDPAWGAFRVFKDGKAIVDWGPTHNMASDGAQGVAEYAAALGVSTAQAAGSLGLPTWAQEIITSLGNSPTLEQLAAATEQIVTQKAALDANSNSGVTLVEQGAAQLDYSASTVSGLEQISTNVMSAGDRITAAVEALRSSIETGMAAIADASQQTAAMLRTWDDGGAIVTTPAA